MTRQQVSQHRWREGEINQYKAVTISWSEYMAIRCPYKNEIAWIKALIATVDGVKPATRFNPEDFREIMRMQRGLTVWQKTKSNQMIPIVGPNQIAPALFFHEINIAK
jgi:hypothetical protein